MSAVPAETFEMLPMQESDLEEVAAAEQSLYAFPWTRRNFRDSLVAGYSAWVARDHGWLAAYAVMMMVLDETHLLNISVLAHWQGKGYGRHLLERLCATARGSGAMRMYLEVRPSNAVAMSLYRSFGFVTIGVRRGYYPARCGREDAVIMSMEL